MHVRYLRAAQDTKYGTEIREQESGLNPDFLFFFLWATYARRGEIMLFALELEKCTINKVPLNDCTPVTGRGCARLVSALLRVYSYRLVLTPTKRRKVSSYAPSPCVSHCPWQCRQNLFPAFILFLAFATISKAALSPITICLLYTSPSPRD